MVDKIKNYFSSIHVSPIGWLLAISGILIGRFFLEALSSPTQSGFLAIDSSTLVHYYLFFITFAFVLMIFLYFFIPKWRDIIPQFVSSAFLIIFLGPIIDFVVTSGKGFTMAYIFNTPKELLYSFLTFFGPILDYGITIGLRVEVFVMLLSIGLIVFLVQKSFLRSILSVLSLYSLIFIFLSLPSFISMAGNIFVDWNYFKDPIIFFQNIIDNSSTTLNSIHGTLRFESIQRFFEVGFNLVMSKILVILLTIFSGIWFYIYTPKKFIAIIKNSRPERVAHYILMMTLGILVAFRLYSPIQINFNDILSIIVLCISIYMGWMSAVCINDVVDKEIDEVSNKNRPMIKDEITAENMKEISILFFVFSLISAFVAGISALFFVTAFITIYYIYSVPPTRFKLIPFLSSFLIGLCCLTIVLAGFFTISPIKTIYSFPSEYIFGVVIVFFLWSHIRDMKDIEGDKLANVKTVSVLFGDIWGPRVVGILSGSAFLLVPLFLKSSSMFIFAIPACVATYIFCNKKPYKEYKLFIVYNLFIACVFLFWI